MNKKILFIVGIVALLVVLGIIIYANNSVFLADIVGYSPVYKADYGHICCLAGATENLAGIRYADDVKETTCSEYVDSCTMTLTNKGICKTLGIPYNIQATYQICNADGSGCANYQNVLTPNQQTSFTLPTGKKVIFNHGLINDMGCYTWERTGAPYKLISEENGKIFTTASGGCYLTNELQHQVVSESPNPIPKGYQYCQNYLVDFVQVATKTYNYNGQQVVCQANQVYSIDTTKAGEKIQGNAIASVQCCPDQPNCDVNTFKFVTNNQRECTYSTECPNAGNPFPSTQVTALQYSCDNGNCVQNTINVECTSDAVCQQRHGEHSVCDLSLANYGHCINSQTGIYCGDGYCDIGESKSSCPQDCALQCAAGEKLVTQVKNISSLFCPFGLFGICEKSTLQFCQSAGFNWLILLWILIGILTIILLWKFGILQKLLPIIKSIPLYIKLIIAVVLVIILLAVIKI